MSLLFGCPGVTGLKGQMMLVGMNEQVHPEKWRISSHVASLEANIIREILKITTKPGIISFAGGLPAPELFPLEKLQEISKLVIEKYKSNCFQYSLSRGIPQLRELVAQRATNRGTPSDIENILITSGAQQAIELLARAFIEPGDYVLVENPTYLGALQAFNYYQARYATVEMDDHGMIIDQVEEKILKYRPKLIYTVSNFQNPTGITLSAERRKELVTLAAEHDVPVMDDNPYGEIRFAGERVPTLKSMGGNEVVALRTFSKSVAPGFRVGWMNGPKSIIEQFEKVKQCVDLHSNTFGQYVLYEFVSAGYLEPQIERIIADYRVKRNLMLKMMEEHFPGEAKWTRPEGGMFVWVELPAHVSTRELLNKAIEKNVAFVYGQPFYPYGEGENTMRLNFSTPTPDQIKEGMERLGTVIKENI
jgi:2-aminoadipate transaminase